MDGAVGGNTRNVVQVDIHNDDELEGAVGGAITNVLQADLHNDGAKAVLDQEMDEIDDKISLI